MMIFQRSEEWNAMCESFTAQTLGSYDDACKTTIFRELPNHEQLECMIAGVLIGLLIVSMNRVKDDDGVDYIEKYIADCLPQARVGASRFLVGES